MKLYNVQELKHSRIFFDQKPPMFFAIFIGSVLVILVLALWICTILPKNYIVQAQGTITTDDNTYVGALSDGMVVEIKKQEGDQVEKGDVLFTVSNGSEGLQHEAVTKQLDQANEKLKAMELYENSLINGVNYLVNEGLQQEYYGKMEYYLSMLKDEANSAKTQQDELQKKKDKLQTKQQEVQTLQQEHDTLTTQLNEEQTKAVETPIPEQTEEVPNETTPESVPLPEVPSDNTSKIEELKGNIESKKSEIESKKSEIESLESEISQAEQQGSGSQANQTKLQLISELGSARTTLETNIVELQGQVDAYKSQDALTEVKATQSGFIHYLTPLKDGMTIQKAQTIAEISQNKENQMLVEAYIQATDISKVSIDDEVKVALEGVNTQKYGTLQGTLTSIDSGTLTQESNNGNIVLYKCQIAINDKSLQASNGEKIKAMKSMPVTARIVYDRETYMDWLLEMLNFRM